MRGGGGTSISEIITYFFKGHFHLWYVYLLIGLYLILPLLRLWVKKDNKKYVEYFIILSLIFTYLIPQIIKVIGYYSSTCGYLDEIIANMNLQYLGGYTTYFILGWYLNNFKLKNKNYIYILGIISSIFTLISTYILSVSTGKAIQMYGNLTINVFLQATCFFVFIKDRYENKNKASKFIYLISKNSLGIYAIHVLLVSIVSAFVEKINYNNAIINITFSYLIVLVISLIATGIMRKLPILKKVV